VREQDEHQDLLLALVVDVASMEEFPQLRRAEDSATKIAEARAAVAHLRTLVKPYEEALLERQRERERIDAPAALTVISDTSPPQPFNAPSSVTTPAIAVLFDGSPRPAGRPRLARSRDRPRRRPATRRRQHRC
jgi:hypothetical protein